MPSGGSQADDDAALADALFTLMPMVVAHINKRLEELDMTNTDLWALRSIEGPMRMKDLAEVMKFDPSYVTAVADRLEKLSLIERQPHPTDRRVKNLVLTAKGKRLRANIPELIWSGTNLFSELTAKERKQFLDLVAKVAPARQAVEFR